MSHSVTPYDLAQGHLGVREIPGKNAHPLIVRWLRALSTGIGDDETPWCAAFVNAMALEAGYERSGKLNARSFLTVGRAVPHDEATRGDVAVLWRGSRDSWQGHVGFLDHWNRSRGLLYILGGNQADEVNITAYPADRPTGCWASAGCGRCRYCRGMSPNATSKPPAGGLPGNASLSLDKRSYAPAATFSPPPPRPWPAKAKSPGSRTLSESR